ncbi:hypothetical protein Leryth_004954 [Lithospermum erythrorhizon]|nr:hypothetical protein Leryth_004954 [Lithospermum erythrorhizon]
MQGLETTTLVLQDNGNERSISVFVSAQRELWFGAWWIVMAQNLASLSAVQANQRAFHPKHWEELHDSPPGKCPTLLMPSLADQLPPPASDPRHRQGQKDR